MAAIFAGVLPIPSPTDIDLLGKRAPPSAEHWLGNDQLGRDVLARLIYGARVSLTVGLLAPVIGVTIGGALGMLAGYFRGRFETFVVGGVDVLLAFPPLVFALAVTAYLGQSVLNITLVIGILGIPAFTRVARAVTLSLSEREFVTAARALGATHTRILLRELLPNVALPLVAFFLLGVAVTIVVEGALSFLGLGVPPPAPSWGSMIGEGRESLDIAPWLAFMPARRDVPDRAGLQRGRRHLAGADRSSSGGVVSAPLPSPPLLSIEGVSVSLPTPRGALKAVDNVDLTLAAGSTLGRRGRIGLRQDHAVARHPAAAAQAGQAFRPGDVQWPRSRGAAGPRRCAACGGPSSRSSSRIR